MVLYVSVFYSLNKSPSFGAFEKLKMANNNTFANEVISFRKKRKELNSFQQVIEAYFLRRLPKNFLLPERLIEDIVNFMKRNSVVPVNSFSNQKTLLKVCCLKCCKAYAMTSAKRYSLSEKGIRYLEDIFKIEEGHDGFYLDNGILKRCSISS